MLVVLLGNVPALPAQSLAAEKSKNWFQRELTYFRTYPLLDKAYRYVNAGESAKALDELKKLLAIDPDNLEVRQMIMVLRYKHQQYDEALKQADYILSKNPEQEKALLFRANINESLGKTKASLEDYTKVAGIPGIPAEDRKHALTSMVNLLASTGQNQKALEVIGTRLEDGKNSYFLQFTKGTLLVRTEQPHAAKGAFEQAFKLARGKKQYMQAGRALVEVCLQSGETGAAKNHLLDLINVAPDDNEFRQLANLFYKEGNYQKAEEYIRLALQQKDSDDGQLFLANILYMRGENQQAVDIFRLLLYRTADPEKQAELYMHIGSVYDSVGEDELAAQAFGQAAEKTHLPDHYLALARSQEKFGKYLPAAETLEQVPTLSDRPDMQLELAEIYFKLGQYPKALEQFQQINVSELSADKAASVNLRIAFLASKSGQYSLANACLKKALNYGAEPIPVYLSMAENFRKAGDVKCQGSALEKAQELAIQYNAPAKGRNAAESEYLSQLYLQAGYYYARVQHYPQAVTALNRAIALRPNDPVLLLAAADTLITSGQPEKAARFLNRYYAMAAPPDRKQARMLSDLGFSLHRAHLDVPAKKAFLCALKTKGLPANARADILLTLTESTRRENDLEGVANYLKKVLNLKNVSAEKRLFALTSLGQLRMDQGNRDAARQLFKKVVSEGGDSWKIRFSLGLLAYQEKDLEDALIQFRKSSQMGGGVKPLVGLGYTYKEIGKTGMAIHSFLPAEKDITQLNEDQQRLYFNALGYLYADESRIATSLAKFQRSLAIKYDPVIAYQVGRCRRILGQYEQAKSSLEKIAEDKLPSDLQAKRWEELARIDSHNEDFDESIIEWRRAIEVEPSAERYYLQGLDFQEMGKYREASDAFRQALRLEDNTSYLVALGYSLDNEQKTSDAVDIFEEVVQRDPDYLDVWEQLGYIYMKEVDNDKAVECFKTAIDNKPLYPVHNEEEAAELEMDMYRLRSEVSEMHTDLYALAYLTYIAGDSGKLKTNGGSGADIVRPNSGAEFYWIPPVIGRRDKRVFQLLARINWDLDDKSLNFQEETYQGALGLRVKPFKDYNLHLGLERLFKIGDEAEDNTLARAMYSWTDGYGPKPLEKWWNYTLFYGEAAYYLEDSQRAMFAAEARQGVTKPLGNSWLLTPHLVADAKLWSPDRDHSSFWEAGIGVSLKYLFNGGNYEIKRSYAEILAQYKVGEFYNADEDMEDSINALFVSCIVRF